MDKLERMRRVSERVDLALNAEKDDSFMEFKPSDIQLFIDELSLAGDREATLTKRLEGARTILNAVHNSESFDSRTRAVRLYELTDELHEEINCWLSTDKGEGV